MLEIQTSNLHSVLNDYIWIQITSCILSSNLSVTRAKHKKEKVQARDTSKLIFVKTFIAYILLHQKRRPSSKSRWLLCLYVLHQLNYGLWTTNEITLTGISTCSSQNTHMDSFASLIQLSISELPINRLCFNSQIEHAERPTAPTVYLTQWVVTFFGFWQVNS